METNILVTISDHEGQILEQGEARLVQDTLWEYATSSLTEGNVTVEAFDPAGNVTKLEA